MIGWNRFGNSLRKPVALPKLLGVYDPHDGRHDAHHRRYLVQVPQDGLPMLQTAR